MYSLLFFLVRKKKGSGYGCVLKPTCKVFCVAVHIPGFVLKIFINRYYSLSKRYYGVLSLLFSFTPINFFRISFF